MKKHEKSSVNTIVVIVILMFVSRLVGLIRDTSISQQLGANAATDSYFMGQLLTTSLFLGLGSAIATNLIPKVIKENERGKIFAGRIFNLLALVSLLGVGIYYVAAPAVITWYARGFDQEKIQMTVQLTRYLLPAIVFVILTYFFIGLLQANEIFTIPAMVSIPFNVLFFVYLYSQLQTLGVQGLAVVTTLGWLVQFLFVLIPSIRHGLIQFSLSMDIKRIGGDHFFVALIPLVVIISTHTLNIMIDQRQAAFFGDGSTSAIYYGNILFRAIVTTTVYGITAVMFPKFNRRFIEDNIEGLNQSVINVLRSIFLLLIPMSVGLIVLGEETITLVFQRGAFTSDNTYETMVAFSGYTSFMIAFGIQEVLNKAYFTLENRRTPLLLTVLILVSNLILSALLAPRFGLLGLAVGTSLAYYLGALISLFVFFRQQKKEGFKRMARTFYKALIAAMAMGVVVWVVKQNMLIKWFNPNQTVDNLLILMLSAFLGLIVYYGALLAVKEELITYNTQVIKEKLFGHSR